MMISWKLTSNKIYVSIILSKISTLTIKIAALADFIKNSYAQEFKAQIFAFIRAKLNIKPRIEKEIEDAKWY